MSKTVEEADWADRRAAELLPCEGLEPWCVDENQIPTGEHYQGDTCHARYRKMFANALRDGDAHGAAEEREAAAQIADEGTRQYFDPEDDDYARGYFDASREVAARIRQRGEK